MMRSYLRKAPIFFAKRTFSACHFTTDFPTIDTGEYSKTLYNHLKKHKLKCNKLNSEFMDMTSKDDACTVTMGALRKQIAENSQQEKLFNNYRDLFV
jgi:hypothetical protein